MILTNKEFDNKFDYDEATGVLTRKHWASSSAPAGSQVGNLASNGYLNTQINGRNAKVHRLIYERYVGEIPPEYDIDHIDRNRANNRLANLRAVTRSVNLANSQRRGSGKYLKGVYKHRNKYCAQITSNGERRFIGSYTTETEAHEAYMVEARLLYGEFANSGA